MRKLGLKIYETTRAYSLISQSILTIPAYFLFQLPHAVPLSFTDSRGKHC